MIHGDVLTVDRRIILPTVAPEWSVRVSEVDRGNGAGQLSRDQIAHDLHCMKVVAVEKNNIYQAVMSSESRHISVCICTYKRPVLLKRLLDRLEQQRTDNQFVYSIIVADNDDHLSARSVVAEFAAKSQINVTYCSEPRQNIALARNKALEHSKGNFIAFIDDDEFPEADWLLMMLRTCRIIRRREYWARYGRTSRSCLRAGSSRVVSVNVRSTRPVM